MKTETMFRLLGEMLAPSPELPAKMGTPSHQSVLQTAPPRGGAIESSDILAQAERALDARPWGCGESMTDRMEIFERLTRAAAKKLHTHYLSEMAHFQAAIRENTFDFWKAVRRYLICFGIQDSGRL